MTLTNAVRTAIAHGNTLSNIIPAKWAETYRCDTESVRAEFERQLTTLSLKPSQPVEDE